MKTALITGASKGLGKCLSNILSKNDYKVIGTYNNTKISDDIIDYQKCDLSNLDDINKLCDYIKSEYKHIDLIINNAALCLDNDFYDKTFDEFQKVLIVNLISPFILIQTLSKIMNNGTIVNISSLDASKTYSTYSMDYAASKAGLENLTKNISNRLDNIKIFAVSLAWMNTDTVLSMDPKYLDSELKRCNQNKLLDYKEVSNKIIDLINDNNIKTGDIIRIEE